MDALKRFYAQRSGLTGTEKKQEVAKYDRPTVIVRNSFCELHAIPEAALEAIRDALTYKNEQIAQEKIRTFRLISMAKARGQGKLIYKLKCTLDELNAQEIVCWLQGNKVPTGLIQIVRGILGEFQVQFDEQDTRIVPSPEHSFGWLEQQFPLRYYQNDMVELGLSNSRGVFVSAVGTGKTRILKELLHRIQVTSMIVVPSSALLEQLYQDLALSFGKKQVAIINTPQVKKALKKKNPKFAPIRIVTVQTLAALQKKALLKPLLADVKLLAVDEIHHAGSKSYTDLLPLLDHIYYRFGFTGTFLRNDSKTLDMWGFLSNVLYEYPAWKATQEGFLTPVKFQIYPLRGRRCGQYQQEYNKNYCGSDEILARIRQIVEGIPEDRQILILVDRKDAAGKVIHEMLLDCGMSNAYLSGDDEKEDVAEAIKAFNAKKIRMLVGSTIIGEGVDVYATDHLILARGGKSEIAIVQAIGRAVRKAKGKDLAFVHDFVFEGTKFLERHLKQRLEIYKNSFGGEIEEVA